MAEVRPRSQQQQPSSSPQQDAALVAAIAALLAVKAAPRPTALKIAALLGVPVAAVVPVVGIALAAPWGTNVRGLRPGGSPAATRTNLESEGAYRAAYVLAASRRWHEGLKNGVSEEVLKEREDRFFKQHLEAQANRRVASAAVDKMARKYGATLGWYAVLDTKTSPECKAAHGKNFDIGKRPVIGYPGSVHPHCRCKPGKAFATNQTVYNIKPERRAA